MALCFLANTFTPAQAQSPAPSASSSLPAAEVERRWEENPAHESYYPSAGTKRVEYREGVFVGYCGYERSGTKPLFAFGHGLAYTTFKYSNLSIRPVGGGASSGLPSGPRYEVSFEVRNTGSREGYDVAQIYVGDTHAALPRPARELKGFVKVNLRPGESRRVTARLDARSLSCYDADAKQWRAEPGDFSMLVGSSSELIELRGKLKLEAAVTSTGK